MSPPQRVRLIGGRWRGSVLPVADRPGLRPTPARVRETLFNWLGQDLTGWRVLDAFAGSGALGFEAASRGAVQALLIERDAQALRALAAARERLGATGVQVQSGDALTAMARLPAASFELVLLDPPFGEPALLQRALAQAARLVVVGGWIYAEWGEALPAPPGCVLHRQGHAGAVHHHLFRREDCAPGDGAAPGDAPTLAP